MTSLWTNGGEGRTLLPPAAFPDEATLQSLVEEAPELVPLSGDPGLVIVGREVGLANGSLDLLAVESTGRPVILEIKLARSSEARRAVVAQALSYAAFLKGMELEALEQGPLRRHLADRGFSDLVDACRSGDQAESAPTEQIRSALTESLASGTFRVVLLLDDAPYELVRLVGYLEGLSGRLTIDLVTVTAYDVGGTRILVPQRVEPDRVIAESSSGGLRSAPSSNVELARGAEMFRSAIAASPQEHRAELARLCAWAERLGEAGLAELESYRGTTGRHTLLPRLPGEGRGLVTVWNDGGPPLSLWRSVFEKRAPGSIDSLEALIAPTQIGQGNIIREPTDETLAVLTHA
ncbi:MAG: hypothetical protein ACREMY_01210, partial [bacterium]